MYAYVCVCVCVCRPMYAYVYVYVYVGLCMCICICITICKCTMICICKLNMPHQSGKNCARRVNGCNKHQRRKDVETGWPQKDLLNLHRSIMNGGLSTLM